MGCAAKSHTMKPFSLSIWGKVLLCRISPCWSFCFPLLCVRFPSVTCRNPSGPCSSVGWDYFLPFMSLIHFKEWATKACFKNEQKLCCRTLVTSHHYFFVMLFLKIFRALFLLWGCAGSLTEPSATAQQCCCGKLTVINWSVRIHDAIF